MHGVALGSFRTPNLHEYVCQFVGISQKLQIRNLEFVCAHLPGIFSKKCGKPINKHSSVSSRTSSALRCGGGGVCFKEIGVTDRAAAAAAALAEAFDRAVGYGDEGALPSLLPVLRSFMGVLHNKRENMES